MGSENLIEVTDSTFEAEVLQSKVPVLVDFWAPWCAPCRAIAPVLEELARAHQGRLKVVKVNLDDNIAVAQQYRVTAIPTVIMVKDGAPVEQVVGSKNKQFFEELVARHLS